MANTPIVSICIPCFNEERTIRKVLEALGRQTYPLSQMEVVIADGMSEDATRARIREFQEANPKLEVRVLDNPKRIIPAALNIAVEAARGKYIVRLDGHSIPHPEYVARSIAGLDQRLGDNIGGIWKIVPPEDNWIAHSIAAAAAHPLGVGDAKYRYADTPGEADTVPFGAFRKDYFTELGGFDESLHTNEDYEFNTRIRQAGGRLWLDPGIQVQYYSRSNLAALARQYARYGYWKARMVRRYPGSLRWRQALPPLFVLSLVVLLLASIWLPAALWLLLAEVVLYVGALIVSGLDVVLDKHNIPLLFGVPIAIAVMHLSWGGAFIWSLITSAFQKAETI
ncbi:MAG TPA: glycosyltransferase family 2 protein [Anaerolineales bacterium]|nr:glycosyltransferase family 2 protein [Anaerolineales bacterium]